ANGPEKHEPLRDGLALKTPGVYRRRPSKARSLGKVRRHLTQPGVVDPRQRLQLAQRVGLGLRATFDDVRVVPVSGLARKLQPNSVRVDEVDAVESRHLWYRADIGDVVGFQSLLDFAEPLQCHDERA